MATRRPPAGTPHEPRLPGSFDDDEVVLDPDEDGDLSDVRIVAVRGDDLDDVELVRCLLDGVRLTAASARRLRLTDVVLRDCELSGVDLQEARWRRVRLERCRAEGVEAGGIRAEDVVVTETKLSDAGLRMGGWTRAAFDEVDLRGADWLESRLAAVAFTGCDLSRAVLTGVGMDAVRFDGSRLDDVRGARALAGATVDSPQLVPVALALFADLGIRVRDGGDDAGDATAEADEGR